MSEVGENISAENASWTFGNEVPKTFSKHVRKSVPFYDVGHELVGKVSDFFVQNNSVCYEIGVSTGGLIKQLAKRHPRAVRWVGIDVEKGMIVQAQKEIAEFDATLKNIELHVDDINTFEYEPTDLIVSYYTIQFVPPRLRQELFNKLFQALNWGGALLVFEKIRGADARFQDILTSLYTDYKIEQGYSPDEIIHKSKSLKGRLEPFSTQGNLDMFERAGFKDVISVFKYLCFEGFLAIK